MMNDGAERSPTCWSAQSAVSDNDLIVSATMWPRNSPSIAHATTLGGSGIGLAAHSRKRRVPY